MKDILNILPGEGIVGHPEIIPIMGCPDVDATTLQVEIMAEDVILEEELDLIHTDVSGLRTREATITRLGRVVLHVGGMAILERIALIHRPSTESPENPHTIHTTHDSHIKCLSMQTRFLGNGCEVLHGTLAPPKLGLNLTPVE